MVVVALAVLRKPSASGGRTMRALVDPYRLRDVDEVTELGHAVIAVDEAGMRRGCGLDPGPRGLRLVERDRDDDAVGGPRRSVQRLPHGQVQPAPSPGRPGHQEDVPADQHMRTLGIPPRGRRDIVTSSTEAGTPTWCETYDIGLMLVREGDDPFVISALEAFGRPLYGGSIE